MLGFKNFQSAAITIADIELFRRIHKHQFALHQLRLKIRLRLQSGMRCSLPIDTATPSRSIHRLIFAPEPQNRTASSPKTSCFVLRSAATLRRK